MPTNRFGDALLKSDVTTVGVIGVNLLVVGVVSGEVCVEVTGDCRTETSSQASESKSTTKSSFLNK